LEKGMSLVFGENYIKTRLTGGSQPMAPFINILGIPAVSVRIPNPDNSIHAPNENIRVGNYLEGIQTCLGILSQSFN
jgi:acetylornithine deacetylase/succinyl-diaminopimelate desuccinylase-like protein